MIDMREAKLARDRRLRRLLLTVMYQTKSNEYGGWISARTLIDVLNPTLPRDQQFEGDEHGLSLLRDLCNKGMAIDRDDRKKRSEPWSAKVASFRITDKGSKLWLEDPDTPPDPDIEDERIGEWERK